MAASKRWNEFSTLKVELSVDGAIWHAKQQPGLLVDKIFEIDTHTERLTITPFTTPDRRSVFVPNRLVLETLDGTVVESRDDPKAGYKGQTGGKRRGTSSAASPTSPARLCGPRSYLALPLHLSRVRE